MLAVVCAAHFASLVLPKHFKFKYVGITCNTFDLSSFCNPTQRTPRGLREAQARPASRRTQSFNHAKKHSTKSQHPRRLYQVRVMGASRLATTKKCVPSQNHATACRYHPEIFTGETRCRAKGIAGTSETRRFPRRDPLLLDMLRPRPANSTRLCTYAALHVRRPARDTHFLLTQG